MVFTQDKILASSPGSLIPVRCTRKEGEPGMRSHVIDTVDYVHGIGNGGPSVSSRNPGKNDKKSLKMAKNEAFFKHFQQYLRKKTLTNLKIRYPCEGGPLLASVAKISFVCPHLKRSAPNNQTISKWRRFGPFRRFWPSQSRQVLEK